MQDVPTAATASATEAADVPASLQHVLVYQLPGCCTAGTALQLRLACKELRGAVDKNVTRSGDSA
jgi:hypothetical protein